MAHLLRVTPLDRIHQIGVASLQQSYESKLNTEQFLVKEEIAHYLHSSGLGHENLGNQLGLSRGQVQGIINGERLPKDNEKLCRARRIGQLTWGRPNWKTIYSKKRKYVMRELLPLLGLQASGLNRRGFSEDVVEDLVSRVTPPSHEITSNIHDYRNWVENQAASSNLSTEDADAAGTFLAAREYLSGFGSIVMSLCRPSITTENCSNLVSTLHAGVVGIHLILSSRRNYKVDPASSIRTLRTVFGVRNLPCDTNSELSMSSIVSRWNLEIEDFNSPEATLGYLTMHSEILRSCVIELSALNSYIAE